ncbi:MAG: cyclic nucleotide-binding domain-containing protein [Verrucomicrobiia bacterium]
MPNDYFIWGIDDSPYGPAELSVLIDWISDGRVQADTWVFARHDGCWQRAGEILELQAFFNQEIFVASGMPLVSGMPLASDTPLGAGIPSGSLRRIRILSQMNDAQLDHLARFLEVHHVPQRLAIVNQGDPGDGMYLILQGELRARVMQDGQETILSTFETGDFFGDLALFDRGPRSADVIANEDSTLLKISTAAFDRLTREAPALATVFLQATARTLAARIRADNKRLNRVSQQFRTSI